MAIDLKTLYHLKAGPLTYAGAMAAFRTMVNKRRFQDQLDFPLNFTSLPPTPPHTDMGTFLVRSINCGFYNGELSIRQEGRFYLVPKDTKPQMIHQQSGLRVTVEQ